MQMEGLDINSNCTHHTIMILKATKLISLCNAYLSMSKIADMNKYPQKQKFKYPKKKTYFE